MITFIVIVIALMVTILVADELLWESTSGDLHR
jgi:hypothetical protein